MKDKAYGGISWYGFVLVVLWIFVSLFFILPLALSSSVVIEGFVAAVLICWWFLYVKYASSDTRLEESFLFLKFFFDKYSGLHTIAKYDIDVKFLEDVFPLVDIHEGGLIQFKDKTFGILLRYFPERVNEEDLETHGIRMQEVIDGMAGNTSIKFIASSKYNIRKPILDKLLSAMNQRNVNRQIYEYLHSLYSMIENKDGNTIDWTFNIFFGLGKFDNLQDATDQMYSEYPGLVDSLKEVDITVIKLTDRVDIAKEYRQMTLPMVI
ncbi:MAG TPA: hypothetical protein VF360_03205 [Candidatus Methanoperedens sp.]